MFHLVLLRTSKEGLVAELNSAIAKLELTLKPLKLQHSGSSTLQSFTEEPNAQFVVGQKLGKTSRIKPFVRASTLASKHIWCGWNRHIVNFASQRLTPE